MTPGEDFILRPLQLSDVASAMRLSSAEGWNQTEKDWKLLIAGPENVCMLAERDHKVVGTTTAINYSNRIAWIGMVLVDKDYRGRGVSTLLLNEVFRKLDLCRSVKLDATPQGQRLYKNFDFKDEYLISRMVNSSVSHSPSENDADVGLSPAQLENLEEMARLDELVFGANRLQLIEFLIKEYPGKAWVLKRNGRITGFALGRDGNKYHQIGPVAASSAMDAKILITKALQQLAGKQLVIDVLCDKEDLLSWLLSLGFKQQRYFIRMYRKENPLPGISARQYLICGPEFG